MKKLFLYTLGFIIALFNTTMFADDDALETAFGKLITSETITLNLSKDTTENMALTLNSLKDNSNYQYYPDKEYGYADLYLAKDLSDAFITRPDNSIGYPNYLKVVFGDLNGLSNTKFNLKTNLSDQSINFTGSNNDEVHFSYNALNTIMEVLGLDGSDDDLDDSDSESDSSIQNLFNKISAVSNDEESGEEFFKDFSPTDNVKLSFYKLTSDELAVSRADLENNSDTRKLELNNKKVDEIISVYLSEDKLSLYIYSDLENGSKNSYIKFTKSETADEEENKNIDVSVYTALSSEMLNFDGSSDEEVNITFNLQELIAQVMFFISA